jgi:hypothetical protein
LVLTLSFALVSFASSPAWAVSKPASSSASQAQYQRAAPSLRAGGSNLSGSLPFTGAWLLPLLAGGIVFIAAGGVLRTRVNERRQR